MLPRKPPWGSTDCEKVKDIFQGQMEEIVNRKSDIHPQTDWYDIQKAVETAVIYTTNLNQEV